MSELKAIEAGLIASDFGSTLAVLSSGIGLNGCLAGTGRIKKGLIMLDCDRLRPIGTVLGTDLKSPGAKAPCGFESRPRQGNIFNEFSELHGTPTRESARGESVGSSKLYRFCTGHLKPPELKISMGRETITTVTTPRMG